MVLSLNYVLFSRTILYIMAKYSLLSRCFSSSRICCCIFSFSAYNCKESDKAFNKIILGNATALVEQRRV